MAGRMGGSGRGKPTMSFSIEQLGVSKGELSPVKQPALHYPPLDHKPLPIEMTTEMNYMVELRSNFAEYMQESLNNVQATIVKQDIERFCENYEEVALQQEYNKMKYEFKQDWNKVPSELKSQVHKFNSRKRKYMDMEKKFMELEKKEKIKQIKFGNEEEKEQEDKEDEQEEEKQANEKEVDEQEEEVDEEMDIGTDYADGYFETGEEYFSEDDNDDDPTY